MLEEHTVVTALRALLTVIFLMARPLMATHVVLCLCTSLCLCTYREVIMTSSNFLYMFPKGIKTFSEELLARGYIGFKQ